MGKRATIDLIIVLTILALILCVWIVYALGFPEEYRFGISISFLCCWE